MKKGKLIIISGFSGTGKGTLIKKLMDSYPGQYAFSISATTRQPRPGEVDGREYFFISHEDFESMLACGKLLEYTRYGDNYYGTPADPIDRMLGDGKNIILDIEVTGMHQVTAIRNDVLTVFIIPPSTDELISRLTGRGTESEQDIAKRFQRATEEAAFATEYDCIIKNETLEVGVDELAHFIQNGSQDTQKRLSNLALAEEIGEGLKRYLSQGD